MKISLKYEYGNLFVNTLDYLDDSTSVCYMAYRLDSNSEIDPLNDTIIEFATVKELSTVLKLGITMYDTYFSDSANSFHATYAKNAIICYGDYTIKLDNETNLQSHRMIMSNSFYDDKIIIPIYIAKMLYQVIKEEDYEDLKNRSKAKFYKKKKKAKSDGISSLSMGEIAKIVSTLDDDDEDNDEIED